MEDYEKIVLAISLTVPALALALTAKRAPQVTFIVLLISLTVYPAQLTSTSGSYAGLSQSSPIVATYTLAILLAIVAVSRRASGFTASGFEPFIAFAVFGALFLWSWNSYTQAGYVQLALGIAAWILGRSFGQRTAGDPKWQQLIVLAVFSIVALQLFVSLLQLVGRDLFPLAPHIAEIMGSRVHGTLNHPNNLGKVIVLLAALVLPSLDDDSRRLRRWTVTTILLAGVVVTLTQGRANVIAFVAMIAIRIATLRGANATGQRVLVSLLAAVGLVPLLPLILDRFAADPEGGSREHLIEVAVAAFARSPLWGIGPNEYVHVVGQFDAMTANDLPVHNSYMLLLVDLGAVGATLFLLPMVASVIKSWRYRNAPGYMGRRAASSLSIGIAFIVVASTGWGAVSSYILPMWMLTLGYLLPRPRATDLGSPPDTQARLGAHEWTPAFSNTSLRASKRTEHA